MCKGENKHKVRDKTGIKKNKHTSKQKYTDLSMGRLINSRSHRKRSSVKLTIQTFDPAFGIGELLPEIFYFFMASGLAFADLQQLIDAVYRYRIIY
jgi:hypothetical protein